MLIYWVGNYDHFVSDNGGEIGAADKHVLGANLDRKCVVPGYALPGNKTFKHCKVFILTGIRVTRGLPLVPELFLFPLVLVHSETGLGEPKLREKVNLNHHI